VTVTFDLPRSYEVKVIPDKIPSIYNGEKTVIFGLLMDKSDDKGRDGLMCKAILSGDILGKKFQFEIPFKLPDLQAGEGVSVIHQLAAKVMIQEWQDDGEPYEQRYKKEIIELSCDASVASRYTAYIAVDEAQNKPVSGSMQSYELTTRMTSSFGGGGRGGMRRMKKGGACSAPKPKMAAPKKKAKDYKVEDEYSYDEGAFLPRPPSRSTASSAPPLPKQFDPSFVVSLQQFDGSWLLNDKLAGVVSKSVEELKSCCPVSCDAAMMANVWATLVVIELLKKKYPSMLEELELIIMKAQQWVGKQVLPSGVDLTVLKDASKKIV